MLADGEKTVLDEDGPSHFASANSYAIPIWHMYFEEDGTISLWKTELGLRKFKLRDKPETILKYIEDNNAPPPAPPVRKRPSVDLDISARLSRLKL
jgi:hypothetical protein